MKICFVVRSLYSQALTYTTTHLAYEAYKKGHKVYYTTINSFSFNDQEKVVATVAIPQPGTFSSRHQFLQYLKSEACEKKEIDVSDCDVVFLRYNPNELESDRDKNKLPIVEFGRLLKQRGVLVLNDPVGILKASSKMYLASLPSDIRPKTLVSRSAIKIKEFIKDLKKPAIIKPLHGFGGQDVFFIRNSSKELNINQIISTVSKNGYVIAQEYLPQVKKGDKRLLLLNGEPIRIGKHVAMYRRVSAKDEIRSNMHVGGKRRKSDFTEIERKIAESIRPKLISDGLYFVGADIVGNKLLEVNVFCPGGINNINELYEINVGSYIIDDLEQRVRLHRSITRPQLALAKTNT